MKMSKLSRMVKEIKNLAEDLKSSRMFRSHQRKMGEGCMEESDYFKETVALLVKHYNSFLELAREKKYLEEEYIFHKLPDDAEVQQVYIDAALLAKYLTEEEKTINFDIDCHDEGHGISIHKIKINEDELAKEEAEIAEQEAELAAQETELAEQETELAEQEAEFAEQEISLDIELDDHSGDLKIKTDIETEIK